MPEADGVASTIDCDLSVRQYKTMARRANKRGRRVFPSHSKVANYKRQKCTPNGIRSPNDFSIEVDLEDVMHHQASKLLTPEVKRKMKMLKEEGATFVLYYKLAFRLITFSSFAKTESAFAN